MKKMKKMKNKSHSLYQGIRKYLISLLKQIIGVSLLFFIMLLLTGGNPSGSIVGFTFILSISFVVWSEIKKVNLMQNEAHLLERNSQTLVDQLPKTIYISSATITVGSSTYLTDKIYAVKSVRVLASVLELITRGRTYAILIRFDGRDIALIKNRDKNTIIRVVKEIREAMDQYTKGNKKYSAYISINPNQDIVDRTVPHGWQLDKIKLGF